MNTKIYGDLSQTMTFYLLAPVFESTFSLYKCFRKIQFAQGSVVLYHSPYEEKMQLTDGVQRTPFDSMQYCHLPQPILGHSI